MSPFEKAIERFDQENSRDPSCLAGGVPRELFLARELTRWVTTLSPNASEALRLAARCQHIRRWEVPRSNFPPDRAGYHRWKNAMKEFHAGLAGQIMRECGYDSGMMERVQDLNLKKHFPHDPEAQIMEDALCLVFLEHQFADLAGRSERPKITNALRKSWGKMSERARELALGLSYSQAQRELLREALD